MTSAARNALPMNRNDASDRIGCQAFMFFFNGTISELIVSSPLVSRKDSGLQPRTSSLSGKRNHSNSRVPRLNWLDRTGPLRWLLVKIKPSLETVIPASAAEYNHAFAKGLFHVELLVGRVNPSSSSFRDRVCLFNFQHHALIGMNLSDSYQAAQLPNLSLNSFFSIILLLT